MDHKLHGGDPGKWTKGEKSFTQWRNAFVEWVQQEYERERAREERERAIVLRPETAAVGTLHRIGQSIMGCTGVNRRGVKHRGVS